MLIPWADYDGLQGHDADQRKLHIFAVDRDRVWLANKTRAGLWTSSGGTELRFDLATARCEAGFGPCRSGGRSSHENNLHDLSSWYLPIGYHQETERLVLMVRGRWQFYLIGVHATEPATILKDWRQILGLHPPFDGFPIVETDLGARPRYGNVEEMLPTKTGLYLTNTTFDHEFAQCWRRRRLYLAARMSPRGRSTAARVREERMIPTTQTIPTIPTIPTILTPATTRATTGAARAPHRPARARR